MSKPLIFFLGVISGEIITILAIMFVGYSYNRYWDKRVKNEQKEKTNKT